MQSDSESIHILQQPSHTNPIQENRCRTNTHFIFVFIFIILIWFAVGIQAFARESTNKFDDVLIKEEDDIFFVFYQYINIILSYLCPPMKTFGNVFLFSLFLGGTSVFINIILIKTFTTTFIYISLLIFGISLISEFIEILYSNLVISIFSFISLTYTITVLFCVHKVGLRMLCEMVKNATRAIIDCPAITLFTFAALTLEILAIIFALNVLKIILSSNDCTFWIVSFSSIIVSGAIVICAFIILFTMAVIAEYTVNWFWITDKKEVSINLILESISKIFRNHLGTIALESTLIMPFIYGTIRAIKYRNKSGGAIYINDIYFESIAKITLVSNIVHFILIHSSIYGTSFIKATKKTFQLVLPNASLYLASIEIFNMMVLIGMVGNTVVMFYTAYVMVRIEHIFVYNMPLPILWGFFCPAITYYILMISVGRALLTNKMITLSAERDSKEYPITAC